MIDFGIVRPGSTIYIEFDSFGADGESLTLTGLAVGDVKIYKDGGTTERASTSGYTLLDTDGIDFDSVTGIHGLSISLADNTTTGFFTAGSHYRVVIDSVTINTQTVSFTAATFTIGYPSAILNTTIASLAIQTSFTLTTGPAEDDALNGMYAIIHDAASAVQFAKVLISDYTGSTKTVTLAAGATFTAAAGDNFCLMDLAPLQAAVVGRTLAVGTSGQADTNITQFGGTNGTFSGGRPEVNTTHVGGSTIQQMGGRVDANAYTVASGAITSSSFAASAIDSSSLAGSAISAIQSGLATASDLSTLYGYVTTTLGSPSDLGSGASIAANLVDIESQTDDIGVAGAGLTATGLATATIDAIRDSVVAQFVDDIGTAQAGGASTIRLRSGASAEDDFYKDAVVKIYDGAGAGQSRQITAYAGTTTKDATTDSPWVTQPDNTSKYIVLGRIV
jgi:hypothetical protein